MSDVKVKVDGGVMIGIISDVKAGTSVSADTPVKGKKPHKSKVEKTEE